MDWVLFLAVAAFLVAAGLRYGNGGRRRGGGYDRGRRYPARQWQPAAAPEPFDAAAQLRHVMAASFSTKKLMNKSEYTVFQVCEEIARSSNRGLRTFAQTSLGEVLRSADGKAYSAINSKRIDILIIDRFGEPAAAVEYQGSGHYQGDAAARDAVKREALRRAGVPYVEILEADCRDTIRQKVSAALRLA